jgi:PGF-pre-PGF domain-containing protein
MVKTGNKRPTGLATVFVLLCLFLVLSTSILLAPAVAHNQSELVDETFDESTELPDLSITAIKPYHYGWSDDYDIAKGEPWFNLMNYVNVTVKNNGTTAAANFEVKLYADGEPIGSKTMDVLEVAATQEVKFAWSLEGAGEDPLSWVDSADGAICTYEDTSTEYSLRALVDESDEIIEGDEDNNELTKEQHVVWNGYVADEPMENYVHDELEGGILYTTGDGGYRSYDTGDSGTDDTYYTINYDLQIPGSTKLARLYFYYTWAKPSYKAPKIDAVLETPSGDSHDLKLEQSYNDIKGDFGADIYAWGTYAYDITNYVQESGSYMLSVKNLNYGGGDSNFADKYSFAPPAILAVYEDETEPKREYWINEGADLLMGGGEERPYGGFLALEDCLNPAEFSGEHLDLEVEEAVLGAVSIWGGNPTTGWHSYLYFNGNALGKDLYEGYSGAYNAEMGGFSMSIGSDDAQIGLELTDVTNDLEDDDNEVIQGDDGDNMMPANAFLMITYKEEEEGDGSGSGGSSAKDTATATATPTPASAASTATVTKASRTIPLLEAGKEVAMIFQDMDVSLLALEADTDVSDAKIVVERINKPVEVTEPSGIPYVYLDISVEHEAETANIEGRIEFKVSKSWITANNIDEATVTLNRYHERDGWTALPTSKVGEEGNATVYFEAETTGFSLFAVTAEEKVETASTSSPRTVSPQTSASTPPPTPAAHEETQTPEAGGASVPGFELMVSLCMLIGGAHLLLIRKKNC